MTATTSHLTQFLPSGSVPAAELPWIPSDTPGKSAKPLRFLDNNSGFVELLRMEPGCIMPLHRHGGEVHAYNLSGERELCTGERIGAGDYVFEPAGNVDWWRVVGNETMIALVVVIGRVEYLHADGRVLQTIDARSQRAEYERYCQMNGMPIRL